MEVPFFTEFIYFTLPMLTFIDNNVNFIYMRKGPVSAYGLLGVNYSLNLGLYCTNLMFDQLLHGLKSSITGYVRVVHLLQLDGLKNSRNGVKGPLTY